MGEITVGVDGWNNHIFWLLYIPLMVPSSVEADVKQHLIWVITAYWMLMSRFNMGRWAKDYGLNTILTFQFQFFLDTLQV